jgi:hypothetical protein
LNEADAPNVDEGGRREAKMVEMIGELSRPDGYISYGRDKLEWVYEEKEQKNTELASEM